MNSRRSTDHSLHVLPWWDVFLVGLAVGSLGIAIWAAIQELQWPDPRFKVLAQIDAVVVVVFLIEFAIRLWRSVDRKTFWRENWYDLIGLVPLYAESWSWLRAMRLLRVLRVFRLFRVVEAGRRLSHSFRFVSTVLRASHLRYTMALGAALILFVSFAFWILERGSNESLRSFDDALWWAVSTASTVGYGDITPRTGAGRLLACALMLFGIGLVGIIASSLSAAIIKVDSDQRQPTLLDELEKLGALRTTGVLTQNEFEVVKRRLLSEEQTQRRPE
jgi:voltage-gated potassium channel